MKIALLLPANIYFCPYIKIYTSILEEAGISYDIIYWDKDGLNEPASHIFKKRASVNANKYAKILDYIRYSSFLKRIIKKNNYSTIIVFGPQISIFLYSFLNKRYPLSFIFDYRDLSIEQLFKKKFDKILSISALNVISSPGFKKCLPENQQYVISHNCNIQEVESALLTNKAYIHTEAPSKIKVLTIGAIRDYEENVSIINALKNNDNFELQIIGKGPASDKIQKYVIDNNIQNVRIVGFYPKDQEANYIANTDIMNIYYPRRLSHDTALSNRFYSSIIHGIPMITTKDTIQGNYTEEYGLGLAIEDTSNLAGQLLNFFNNLNRTEYNNSRKILLKTIKKDYYLFKNEILKALS